MQRFRSFIVLVCIAALIAPSVADAARGGARRAPVRTGTMDPRYAALIINPKTGEVYHQQNADARRYPASLTKMMTLYLLFEAMEKGKVSLSTRMRVSDYASVQPQTNISLTTRDTVPVELAIKALVIRSANDVAVVVAEHLGGSVPNFAKQMTEKARALGMRNTVFQNPHGLPNGNQFTTARDMAKLGIALKRDFPQYYSYFGTRQFSWKGVTYYTHNRVMLRYTGTDGIKTGFINASGFNVVSSVERGGRPLLGVVMGGGSGQWRDDRMIALLNAAYSTMAKRGTARGGVFVENLPQTRAGESVTPSQAIANDTRVRSAVNVASVSADRGVIAAQQVPSANPPVIVQTTPLSQPLPNTLDAQWAARAAGMDNAWGIQVGAFSSKTLAERAALQAYQLAQQSLQGSRIAVVGTGTSSNMVHRARLENLSENQAKRACEMLISNNSPCFIYRAGSQNL